MKDAVTSTFNEIACLQRFPKPDKIVSTPDLTPEALAAVEDVRKRWPKFHPGANLIHLGSSGKGRVALGISIGLMQVGSSVSVLWSAFGQGKTWGEAVEDLGRSVSEVQAKDEEREREMARSRKESAKHHAEAYRRLKEIDPGSEEAKQLRLYLRVESIRCRNVQ